MSAGPAQTPVGHLHADRHGELHERDGGRHDHGRESDADDHVAGAGDYHLPDSTQRDAVERDRDLGGPDVPGTFTYTPPITTVLNAGTDQTLASTSCRPTRPTTTRRPTDRGHQCAEGDAGDHLASAGEHRLRHRAERDAVERDHARARNVRLQPRSGRSSRWAPAQTLSTTFTPTDAGELQHGDGERDHHGREGDAGRSPGRRRRTSPTAPR